MQNFICIFVINLWTRTANWSEFATKYHTILNKGDFVYVQRNDRLLFLFYFILFYDYCVA